MGIGIEVAAGSVSDALSAATCGAGRIEFCSRLSCGGVTPSMSDVRRVLRETGIPVVVLVRPRPGGFVYSPGEIATAVRSIRECASRGVSGIATGALDEFSGIDAKAVSALVGAAGSVPVVFHRAFDRVPDKPAALEILIGLGVSRVLTSGGPPAAADGAGTIASLVEQAGGRIEILPGGGIGSQNAAALAGLTGWIHGSFSDRRGVSGEPVFDPAEFGRVLCALGLSPQAPHSDL